MTEGGTLRERVEALAAAGSSTGITRSQDGETTTWSVGGRPFASVSAAGVELHLDPAIARAATRTPDTSPSDRGQAWVRFAPSELDDHAIDRLEAWFAFARRRASESVHSS